MKKSFIIFFLLLPSLLFGQSFKINLSPKHEQKLGEIKSGHKRMMNYYKFYKKDSARHLKKMYKRTKRYQDSLYKAEVKGEKLKDELTKQGVIGDKQWEYAKQIQHEYGQLKRIVNDSSSNDSTKLAAKAKMKKLLGSKINRELAQGKFTGLQPYKMADSARRQLQDWWAVMKDSTSSDSLKKVAKEKVKSITLAYAMGNPQFQGLYQHYKQYGQKPDWNTLGKQVPGMDTLQNVFDSSPDQLMATAEKVAEQSLSSVGNLNAFSKQAGEVNNFKKQFGGLTNIDSLKKQSKEKLKEQVVDHFAGQADKLQAAQNKMTDLTAKYREFTSSNDVTTGVKRTSLEGKSFKERLVLGGNFNIVSTAPLSIDLSPMAGYRFNTRFYMGLSINYRYTFNDSLRYRNFVSSSNTGFRFFASYDLVKNFFAYTEVEWAGLKVKASESPANQWRVNYFAGIGKKLLVHPKLYVTFTALYNLNNEANNPSYPQKFQIRIGFQTSDLAFRKKKIYYNP